MDEIKPVARYTMFGVDIYYAWDYEKVDDGEWVTYADHQQAIDTLRAEVERLQERLGVQTNNALAILRECDALRKDAERYRWLCDGNGYFMEENYLCGHENDKERADLMIDIEIQAGQ